MEEVRAEGHGCSASNYPLMMMMILNLVCNTCVNRQKEISHVATPIAKNFKKLLELQGNSSWNLEISVQSSTVSEIYFSSKNHKVSTTVALYALIKSQ